MHKYTAYGLGIRSQLELPELVSDPASANDVEVRLGDVAAEIAELLRRDRRDHPALETYRGSWEDGTQVLVRHGRSVVFTPGATTSVEMLRLYVLGTALATVLFQRGRLVLHGNCVAVGGRAVLTVGGPHWGKSSLSAALLQRGHRLIADDVVAAAIEGKDVTVHPGVPRLKLWPDTLRFLGLDPEALPLVRPDADKRSLPAPCFVTSPEPLERIYVLADGNGSRSESLAPQDAFAELVRHSYVRMRRDTAAVEAHFRRCAMLSERVPVLRLVRRRSWDALEEVCRTIEADVSGEKRA